MKLHALRVHQWLPEWDDFHYDKRLRQTRPADSFLVTKLPADLLRRLSGVRRRTTSGPRAADIGIQRAHDAERSAEIASFVRAGYPWASLGTRDQSRFPDLRKPGWLPTAIVANLVTASTVRDGMKAESGDLIKVKDVDGDLVELEIPDAAQRSRWSPKALPPIEIIDGQHRIYAFEQSGTGDQYELPVVLFLDLDISWQAYLFWTINIRPKRISPSLAYDLYPLLRTEEWLEHIEGPVTYRETRAQELTEALWSHPESPWRARISMLGQDRGLVSQAAFIRSLTLSFVRRWEGRGRAVTGGLFGAELSDDTTDVLKWGRAQQAAFLIALWRYLADAVKGTDAEWATDVRAAASADDEWEDPAFGSRFSVITTDQGVRGFQQLANDVCYTLAGELELAAWRRERTRDATDEAEVTESLRELRRLPRARGVLKALGDACATFDWRSAALPGLPESVRTQQAVYRGGTGYRELRRRLLLHVAANASQPTRRAAAQVADALGY